MLDAVPHAIASLHFRDPTDYAAGGEIQLLRDNTVQLVPSPPLRRELDRITECVATAGLKWGASLVVGLAAVGTALFLSRRRTAAFTVLASSGLAGAGAFVVRRHASTMAAWLLSPVPVEAIAMRRLDDGGLSVVMKSGGLRRLAVTLRPEELDLGEADAFMEAYRAVSTG